MNKPYQRQNNLLDQYSELLESSALGKKLNADRFIDSIIAADDKELATFKKFWKKHMKPILSSSSMGELDKVYVSYLKAIQTSLRKVYAQGNAEKLNRLDRIFPIRIFQTVMKPKQTLLTKMKRGFAHGQHDKMLSALHLYFTQQEQTKPQTNVRRRPPMPNVPPPPIPIKTQPVPVVLPPPPIPIKKQQKIDVQNRQRLNKSFPEPHLTFYDDDMIEILRTSGNATQEDVLKYVKLRQDNIVRDALKKMGKVFLFDDLIQAGKKRNFNVAKFMIEVSKPPTSQSKSPPTARSKTTTTMRQKTAGEINLEKIIKEASTMATDLRKYRIEMSKAANDDEKRVALIYNREKAMVHLPIICKEFTKALEQQGIQSYLQNAPSDVVSSFRKTLRDRGNDICNAITVEHGKIYDVKEWNIYEMMYEMELLKDFFKSREQLEARKSQQLIKTLQSF